MAPQGNVGRSDGRTDVGQASQAGTYIGRDYHLLLQGPLPRDSRDSEYQRCQIIFELASHFGLQKKPKKAISNFKAEMPYIGFKSVTSGLMIEGLKWVHIQLLYSKT